MKYELIRFRGQRSRSSPD